MKDKRYFGRLSKEAAKRLNRKPGELVEYTFDDNLPSDYPLMAKDVFIGEKRIAGTVEVDTPIGILPD